VSKRGFAPLSFLPPLLEKERGIQGVRLEGHPELKLREQRDILFGRSLHSGKTDA